jgi:hypothetical protein
VKLISSERRGGIAVTQNVKKETTINLFTYLCGFIKRTITSVESLLPPEITYIYEIGY